MFGELPNFFDRDFAVGYFLPVVTFLAASIAMAKVFNVFPSLLPTWQANLVVGTTLFAVASWLLAIVLLGTNRTILQFLEGYGDLNPFRLIASSAKREISHYDKWIKELSDYREQYEKRLKKLEEVPQDLKEERDRIQQELENIAEKSDKKERELVERFPAERQWVLPTAFGNVIRAFETYSKTMYGIDAIVGWTRLLTVMPKSVFGNAMIPLVAPPHSPCPVVSWPEQWVGGVRIPPGLRGYASAPSSSVSTGKGILHE